MCYLYSIKPVIYSCSDGLFSFTYKQLIQNAYQKKPYVKISLDLFFRKFKIDFCFGVALRKELLYEMSRTCIPFSGTHCFY